MRKQSKASRFAERELHGFDEAGVEERIVVWIEREAGRRVGGRPRREPQHRSSDEPRSDDYVFEGHELEDALEHANGILDDDLACRRTTAARSTSGRSRARSCSARSSAGSSARGRLHEDPARPQPRSRRRVHVLGPRRGRGRPARLRVRARAARHPDAERVGARGPARGDGDLAARVPARPGPLRPASARGEHGLRLRADRRRA